jgi:hypothetical protein
LRWTVFALVLGGIGWGLYAWLPPEPRWALTGMYLAAGLTPDGKAFRTEAVAPHDMPNSFMSPSFPPILPKSGPVQLWDVESGREAMSVLGDLGPRWRVGFSEDGKWLAAIATRSEAGVVEELRCIDLINGGESWTTLTQRSEAWQFSFSPGGALLLLEAPLRLGESSILFLYDTESSRLLARVTTEWWNRKWSPDGEALLIFSAGTDGNASLRRIARNGETEILFKGAGDWLDITPDGKTVLTEPPARDATWPRVTQSILVWDLATGKQRGTIPVSDFHPRSGDNFALMADSRTLWLVHGQPRPGDKLAAWDLGTSQRLGEVALDGADPVYFREQNAVALRRPTGVGQLRYYGARPFGERWGRDWTGKRLTMVSHGGGIEPFLVASGDRAATDTDWAELLDVATGATRLELPMTAGGWHTRRSRGQYVILQEGPSQSGERSRFVELFEDRLLTLLSPRLHGRGTRPSATRVIDTTSGAELGRLDLFGADILDYSPDSRSLLVYQQAVPGGEATLSCYDVPPARAWSRIIGVPLAIGVLLLVLRVGWRRLRRRSPHAPAERALNRSP